MFAASELRTLASMSERADTPPLNWSDLGVSELPTGTVTLLLADVEGSTRLWQTQPEEMTAATARLNRAVDDLVGVHNGVRPVEQGEGDSFVLAFARASDAVECALELQRAPIAPIRLRIGLHTGQIQLRDEGNYAGPTINRTARLRDLAHGGQTVMSGATEQLVVDWLPPDAWLTDLGTHQLRDFPRPERVTQLCHSDLRNEFPPLRTPKSIDTHNLPAQLTSFVGRGAQMDEVRSLLADNRLVTLTGAGGAGKTRLAVEVAAHDRFRLLTGGARTAVRRQQTLRASVDWSHALLTEPERVLFRRLAVFLGGFDLDAAQAAAGDAEVERYQILDQLALLVDKSLVVAENTSGTTRYRLLETVRQYAQEKLGESGEAEAVRSRHRDHYTSMAALLDAPARSDYHQRVEQADEEMENLRSA